MLFGIGAGGLGALSQLKIPPRPWVTKVYAEKASMIPSYFEAAFSRKMLELSR
jgi:hypothetical protein